MSAEGIWARLKNTIGRGRIATVLDGGNVQRVQVQAGADETIDGVPRLAEYGIASVPPAGSDAILLFLAGERSNGVVIATGNQKFRLKGLADGDVALYDSRGQTIVLSAGGMTVKAAGLPIVIENASSVSIDAPTIVNGPLTVAGTITQTGGGAVSFSGVASAPDFATPTLSVENHRHGGVHGGTDDTLTAIPL